MTEKESSETTEVQHSYLDVGPTGPHRWALVIGTLVVVLAIGAAFYGLYTINQSPSPTLTPDPAILTQVAIAEEHSAGEATPSAVPIHATPIPTPTATFVVSATAEPPTYTVQQGDSLIVIARQLNVSVDDLTALNQLSGETIFPSQVLLVPPTSTPWPETGPFLHTVSQGETLFSIAVLYSVTVEEIKTLNGLTSDIIFGGQKILIPAGGVRPPTPTPTPEPWIPAIITDELDSVYSLKTIKGRFTLHIPPGTRAATDSETSNIARLVQNALEYSQEVLQSRLTGRFEVYVADTLFEAPFTARRSFSLPDEGRLFILYDGSDTPLEQLYFTTYAITHLIAARMLEDAASPLLKEGLAVYAAGQALGSEMGQERRHLLPAQFCIALQRTEALPRVSLELTFEGQLGYLEQYFAAGCFVEYLINTEGFSTFSRVYVSGDYRGVYGRTLNQLESEWIAALRDAIDIDDLPLDPEELVSTLTNVNDAYRRLWADFEGTPAQFAAHERLGRARLSLLQGRLVGAKVHLDLFKALLSDQ